MFRTFSLGLVLCGLLLALCGAACHPNAGAEVIDPPSPNPLDVPVSSPQQLGGHQGRLERAPLHPEGQPAANPMRLHVTADGYRLLGWISGEAPLDKGSVQIHLDGKLAADAPISANRTFEWVYKIDEPTGAEVVYGDLTYRVSLAPPAVTAAAAYIFVDRTLYRPEQPLHFVAWVRKPNPTGGFEPVANQDVEVLLKSDSAQLTAARMKLRTDAQGRVSGSYEFSSGDALDTYSLSIKDMAGKASVKLGEFRKSKVKVKIEAERKDSTLHLAFRPQDFMGEPVAGSQMKFTAQVVRDDKLGRSGGDGLKPSEFAYHGFNAGSWPAVELLPEDERLMVMAGASRVGTSAVARRVLSMVESEVVLKDGEARYELPLETRWIDVGASVQVSAVMIDENGREQRASRTVSLKENANTHRLSLEASHVRVRPGEPVKVDAKLFDEHGRPVEATYSAALVRLKEGSSGQIYGGYQGYGGLGSYRPNAGFYLNNTRGWAAPRWFTPVTQTIDRDMIGLHSLVGGRGDFTLASPGAYKVVVSAQRGAESVQEEVGFVVQAEEAIPVLELALERDEFKAGQPLRGVVHSRFVGARALLSVRDGSGLKVWRPLVIGSTQQPFEVALPKGLSRGAVVSVVYPDANGKTHLADRFFRVSPKAQVLEIGVEHKSVYEPGQEVTLDIDVVGGADVDLAVSVYDMSLLGLAPDRSADIRSFFLADERVHAERNLKALERRLGGVTMADVYERLKERVEKETHKEIKRTLKSQVDQFKDGHNIHHYQFTMMLDVLGLSLDVQGHYPYVRLEEGWEDKSFFEMLRLSARNVDVALRGERVVFGNRFALGWGGESQFQFNAGFRGRARGDAHFSNNVAVTGNAVFSEVSAQAMHSAPPAGAVVPMDTEGGQIPVRRDFSDLAHWSGLTRTNADGKATVTFKLPDSLTNWRVVVKAVSPDTRVGQATTRFKTFRPVMVWPMIPRIFTVGDEVELFAKVHNQSSQPQTLTVHFEADQGQILSKPTVEIDLEAGQSAPVYWTYRPAKEGQVQLLMSVKGPLGSDASLKRINVAYPAANEVISHAGLATGAFDVEVDEDVDLDTAQIEVALTPSLVADMVDTLDYLVQYPYGCVEQTMSRFLPAIRVAKILELTGTKHNGLQARLPKVVNAGIKRLLQLQKPDGGWGWYGQGNTHEMMTPYALYGLLQAEAAGYPVNNKMALDKGLARLNQFIRSMGRQQAADRIFNMYVYSMSRPLERGWWEFIEVEASAGRLSDYALAMSLEMAAKAKKRSLARALADRLRARAVKKSDMVHWTTAGFSRWGDDRFEITAAALKALVAYNPDDELIAPVIKFFMSTKRGRKWNSTKDTAMIIYAMSDYVVAKGAKGGKRQTLSFTIGQSAPQRVEFKNGLTQRIKLPGSLLKRGLNELRFEAPEGSRAMFRLEVSYRREGVSMKAHEQGLEVERRVFLVGENGEKGAELKSGDTIERGARIYSEVTVTNVLKQAMRYLVIEDPRSASCEIVPQDDARFVRLSGSHGFNMREDRTRGVDSHYEQTSYKATSGVVMRAELAGRFTVPPASASLLYQTQVRGHSGTFELHVKDTEAQ